MSGPDDRRGPDGGEHPLDVDARFADIIAHFHDDEPSRPEVVDGYDDAAAQDGPAPDGVTDDATPDDGAPDESGPDRAAGPAAAGPRPAPTAAPRAPEPAGEAAAELAEMRRSYEARISAEVDRAVDGPDGGRFVPEDPPPMPRLDLPGRLAWTAVLGGPVFLLLCAMLWQEVPSWLLGSVVTAVVAGFGYLVWRLPRTRDRDDPGDGAIV